MTSEQHRDRIERQALALAEELASHHRFVPHSFTASVVRDLVIFGLLAATILAGTAIANFLGWLS